MILWMQLKELQSLMGRVFKSLYYPSECPCILVLVIIAYWMLLFQLPNWPLEAGPIVAFLIATIESFNSNINTINVIIIPRSFTLLLLSDLRI